VGILREGDGGQGDKPIRLSMKKGWRGQFGGRRIGSVSAARAKMGVGLEKEKHWGRCGKKTWGGGNEGGGGGEGR